MNRDRDFGLHDSPDSEMANNDFIYSTSRTLRLMAAGRHLETMPIIIQLKFKASHSQPLHRTSALSWMTSHSSKEAADCEEAPPTDSEARQRASGRGERRPDSVADIEDSEAHSKAEERGGPRVALPAL